jgi:Fe-S oxidoreductase
MLDRARSSLTELVAVLEPWTSRGIPVVVPEPSCLASFRDELPRLLEDHPGAADLAGLARSPAEHLLRSPGFAELVAARQATDDAATAASPVVVHPHCHGRAIGTPKADLEVLRWLGLAAGTVDGGCCGLAGSFGYRADHEPVSRRIGEEQWLPAVRQAMDTVEAGTLVIDGFSCEMQLGHLSDLESEPLVSLVRRELGV